MVHSGFGESHQHGAARRQSVAILGRVQELGGRVLRVVTLEDKVAIHNAFVDRGFKE